ncbi:MAG TPA: PrsW family intramembrane metalloprotease [Cyanobacteria bacterium UBA11370]|nr:PrsW family intramembrane metalloprotease [Cyanobacteria bacterium UBA11370]HBY80291.1 PrsW family intramembrane metalloprotease [Cyanobacteria bacterium UBA11148]
MTAPPYRAFLRPLSPDGTAKRLPSYPLSDHQELFIGRDPSCEISLDPNQYLVVSRRHAVIRPFSLVANGLPSWEICDLNSINGTYINGWDLRGCHQLRPGDRIELGQNGPQFIFEYQFSTPLLSRRKPSKITTGLFKEPNPNSVTFTQLFPLASTGRDLTQKAFFIPAILTVVFVVLMFAAVGEPVVFNLLLAAYLTGATSYFIYQLCGKPKPWWVLLGCAVCTSLILISPLLPLFIIVFRDILPGSLPNEGEMISFMSLLIHMFFGAGLMEELLKAIPILGAYLLGTILRSPWRERVGVWEPLDGILLGTASAVGFTLLETLGQYVPDIIDTVSFPTSQVSGQLMGLQLLIPRLLGSVAGHIAYSGYFGYFIGLSVLKPSHVLQILTTGYLCASALHALWNATGFVSGLLLGLVGILSYAFLAAAILKARVLSPTRSQNFATRLSKD